MYFVLFLYISGGENMTTTITIRIDENEKDLLLKIAEEQDLTLS
jgi:hypothetical protein